MRRSLLRACRLSFAGLALVVTTAARAYAQGYPCIDTAPPVIGVAMGRSSAYVYLDSDAVPPVQFSSVQVRGGLAFSARADVSIVGPVRFRVEGSTARWNVERQIYDPDRNYEVISTSSIGSVENRQIGASLGLRGGRWPACWYVLAGAALYSLGFGDTTLRRPGGAITAGVEVPVGERVVIQVDVQLNVIDTKALSPFASTTALAAALKGGWAFRFGR